jgi:glycosyltransferase involved in cell wall biosynthesis
MRILIVNYEFPPIGGGGGKASYNLARELVRHGYRVDVLTSRIKGQRAREVLDGITVYRVMSWRKGIHDCGFRGALTFLFFAVLPFLGLTRQNHYDVIHYFFGQPSGILALLPGAQRKTPYIISLRGSDVPGYDEYNWSLQQAHRLVLSATKKIWSRAAALTSVTGSLKNTALQTFPDAEISVIPNGVDSIFFKSSNLTGRQDKRFKLISVARLVERKGIQDVLRALAELNDPELSLLIVGTGNYADRLRKLCGNLSLNGTVSFYGFCHPRKLPGLMGDSDAFILPSRAEAFGNVFAEAMACGLPVIGSDVGGIPDLIDTTNGILVKPGDIEMIKRAIVKIKTSKTLRASMGAANRKKMMADYTWESIGNRYVSVYEDVRKKGNQFALHRP